MGRAGVGEMTQKRSLANWQKHYLERIKDHPVYMRDILNIWEHRGYSVDDARKKYLPLSRPVQEPQLTAQDVSMMSGLEQELE